MNNINKELKNEVLNEWTKLKTNLKLRASKQKSLQSENKSLKFKFNLLLTLIGLGLITWLASDQ